MKKLVVAVVVVLIALIAMTAVAPQAEAAPVKLAWEFDNTNVPDCVKFAVAHSNSDGTGAGAYITTTQTCVAPTDANPLVIQLNPGTYKLWVGPINSSQSFISAPQSVMVTSANPLVQNVHQVP